MQGVCSVLRALSPSHTACTRCICGRAASEPQTGQICKRCRCSKCRQTAAFDAAQQPWTGRGADLFGNVKGGPKAACSSGRGTHQQADNVGWHSLVARRCCTPHTRRRPTMVYSLLVWMRYVRGSLVRIDGLSPVIVQKVPSRMSRLARQRTGVRWRRHGHVGPVRGWILRDVVDWRLGHIMVLLDDGGRARPCALGRCMASTRAIR